MNIEKSIYATKNVFEESFEKGDFYNKQTQDEQHLKAILEFLPIRSGMRILDLGTGSGYLSFAIAQRYSNVSVVGLDIVEKALEQNRQRAREDNINNLTFTTYEGIVFPFEDCEFDMVFSRYALHHFPKIQTSISEVSRVLKKDGHIKFYTQTEWTDICGHEGLNLTDSFVSSIRFPKKKDTAFGFIELLEKYDEKVIAGYDLEIIGNEIYVTEKVNNILFRK